MGRHRVTDCGKVTENVCLNMPEVKDGGYWGHYQADLRLLLPKCVKQYVNKNNLNRKSLFSVQLYRFRDEH